MIKAEFEELLYCCATFVTVINMLISCIMFINVTTALTNFYKESGLIDLFHYYIIYIVTFCLLMSLVIFLYAKTILQKDFYILMCLYGAQVGILLFNLWQMHFLKQINAAWDIYLKNKLYEMYNELI